ncbi:MAG TPA: hypothetical protein VFS42_03140 [Burkholderiaceae bacterium]|nr:hypothetical protein [Burkholderiaceae bacterium]
MNKTARLRILSLLCVIPLAACGGGGGETASSSTPPLAAAPAPADTSSTPDNSNPDTTTDSPPANDSTSSPTASLPPLTTLIRLERGSTLGTAYWPTSSATFAGQGQPVAGIGCGLVNSQNTTYHVHTHLSIIRNGQMLTVPAGIGLVSARPDQGACHYMLHTHDGSGLLHVEAIEKTRFTLGQFFAIWGQPLSRNNVAGITGLPIVVYVDDGTTVNEYAGDLADIELTQARGITIQIGTRLQQIPTYTWEGDGR